MLNEKQIDNNIDWLLNRASSPVKLLTIKNILKDESLITEDLFSNIESSVIVRDILSKQNQDGSWCASGRWASKGAIRKSGYTSVSPKYVTTAWLLPLLGDSGFTTEHLAVKRACEYILTYQQTNGYIGEIHPAKLKKKSEVFTNEPCRFSLILIALAKVKALGDKRVRKAMDLLQSWQRDDGGWVSEKHAIQNDWTRSCPFSSYHSSYAFYCSESDNYKHSLKKALAFLVNHLSEKKPFEIQRFFYHGHSLIHELLMFSEYNISLDTKAVQGLLKWLLSMYHQNQSCFKYQGKPVSQFTFKHDYMDSRVAKYRLFQLIEDDWLTYYATRIFRNILEWHH